MKTQTKLAVISMNHCASVPADSVEVRFVAPDEPGESPVFRVISWTSGRIASVEDYLVPAAANARGRRIARARGLAAVHRVGFERARV